MDGELRSLRLSVRTILVTTEDALAATEDDPPAAIAARDRARELLERLRDRVEASDDPDLIAMYRDAWLLTGYGSVLAIAVAQLGI